MLGAGLTCGTTATSSSSVGSYASTCSEAVDDNYDISYVNGSVTMTAAPLAITVSSGTMTYGGSVPTITPIVAGLQNGDDPSVLGPGLTCDTAADTSSPAGDYASVCSGAMDANYTITYFFGDVTVNPAILQVTASSASVPYGVRPPAITASYSGFVNGDNASSLDDAADLLDDGHVIDSGRELPELVFGRSRSQLHVHLLERDRSTRRRPGGRHGVLGVDDLRGRSAHHHGLVLGLRQRRQRGFPHHAAHLFDGGRVVEPGGAVREFVLGRIGPNYSFSYVNGSVEVDPAPLSIAASSASVTYGSAASTITPSYSGFVNSDSAARSPRRPPARRRPRRRVRSGPTRVPVRAQSTPTTRSATSAVRWSSEPRCWS